MVIGYSTIRYVNSSQALVTNSYKAVSFSLWILTAAAIVKVAEVIFLDKNENNDDFSFVSIL